jgi:predicted nucleic acid-binding protein
LKYVGLDTSVILRLLTGTPESQAQAAMRYLRQLHRFQQTAVVSDLVVAEAYFALSYHYQVPVAEAIEQLLNLLQSGYLHSEPDGAALVALKEAGMGKIGVVDRIIREQYLTFAEEIATFDAQFSRLPNIRLLK